MVVGTGELVFELHDYIIRISDVPMRTCPECGEQSVPGPIAEVVSEIAANLVEGLRKSEADMSMEHLPLSSMTVPFDGSARRPWHEPSMAYA